MTARKIFFYAVCSIAQAVARGFLFERAFGGSVSYIYIMNKIILFLKNSFFVFIPLQIRPRNLLILSLCGCLLGSIVFAAVGTATKYGLYGGTGKKTQFSQKKLK